jgi:predicted transposase YbfD/YdcC
VAIEKNTKTGYFEDKVSANFPENNGLNFIAAKLVIEENCRPRRYSLPQAYIKYKRDFSRYG